MKRSPTSEILFKLAFGYEVMIPTEVSLPKGRSVMVLSDKNDKSLRADSLLIEELSDST